MFGIAWALKLLTVVPQATAALPQFKGLWDQLVATFHKDTDQQTLKDAYATAISGAVDAHEDLQELARQHGG